MNKKRIIYNMTNALRDLRKLLGIYIPNVANNPIKPIMPHRGFGYTMRIIGGKSNKIKDKHMNKYASLPQMKDALIITSLYKNYIDEYYKLTNDFINMTLHNLVNCALLKRKYIIKLIKKINKYKMDKTKMYNYIDKISNKIIK
jgi:hypothetical protein